MSKKFWAVSRTTGEKWKPNRNDVSVRQYLVMYDSGYLAVVSEDFYTYITPLDAKEWEVKTREHESAR